MADILSYNQVLSDLKAEYRKLAKRADQRLVRLEKSGKTTGSAYKFGQMSISRFSTGKRFNVKTPDNVRALRARINAVKRFLESETSTATGIKNVATRISGTIKSRYGVDIEPSQLKNVFEGALWSKLQAKHIGSPTAVRVIGSIKKNKGDMKKAFQDLKEQNVYISTNTKKSISATVGNYMRQNKLDYLFPGD